MFAVRTKSALIRNLINTPRCYLITHTKCVLNYNLRLKSDLRVYYNLKQTIATCLMRKLINLILHEEKEKENGSSGRRCVNDKGHRLHVTLVVKC